MVGRKANPRRVREVLLGVINCRRTGHDTNQNLAPLYPYNPSQIHKGENHGT